MQEDLDEIKETAKTVKEAAEEAEETSREIKQRTQTQSNASTYAAIASRGIPATYTDYTVALSYCVGKEHQNNSAKVYWRPNE